MGWSGRAALRSAVEQVSGEQPAELPNSNYQDWQVTPLSNRLHPTRRDPEHREPHRPRYQLSGASAGSPTVNVNGRNQTSAGHTNLGDPLRRRTRHTPAAGAHRCPRRDHLRDRRTGEPAEQACSRATTSTAKRTSRRPPTKRSSRSRSAWTTHRFEVQLRHQRDRSRNVLATTNIASVGRRSLHPTTSPAGAA